MDTRQNRGHAVVTLYVEGGGDYKDLRSQCRKGFRTFIEKAGLKGRMPAIFASGSRKGAYDDFCFAIANGEAAMLLVDSEAPVDARHARGDPADWRPWSHLAERPGDLWEKPEGAQEMDCHLMVQCMEHWFLADRSTLERFYGQGFKPNSLPHGDKVENVSKVALGKALKAAIKDCKIKTKTSYAKSDHSFLILELIDPIKITIASPWADRFVAHLKSTLAQP